jgi:hypothetical protein
VCFSFAVMIVIRLAVACVNAKGRCASANARSLAQKFPGNGSESRGRTCELWRAIDNEISKAGVNRGTYVR